MLDTSARLLRLLSLLFVRRFWSGADLAERLEVTGRTLRRDIDRLRSLGYPIRATPGVAGGYQLGAGATLPPLQLADDEALAVSVALQTAATTAVVGMEEAGLRALVKLERVLPARLRKRMNALRSTTQLLARPGPRVSAQVLTAMASACSEQTEIRFQYAAAHARDTWGGARPVLDSPGRRKDAATPSDDAEIVERYVQPHGLVNSGYRWYLVAWDVHRTDWRTFRVDRVRGEVVACERFTPRPNPCDGNLQEYVSRSVSFDAYEQKARVVLRLPLAVAAERISPAAGVLQSYGEDDCVLLTGAASFESLAVHLLLLGCDFEVQEPESLVAYLRVLHERLGRSCVKPIP